MALDGMRIHVTRRINLARRKARVEFGAQPLRCQFAVDAAESIGWRSSRQIQDGLAGPIQELSSCVRVCVQALLACLELPGSFFAANRPLMLGRL